jgi:hypothetical protein
MDVFIHMTTNNYRHHLGAVVFYLTKILNYAIVKVDKDRLFSLIINDIGGCHASNY